MHPNVRRAIVRGYYPGPKWRARVMAMTDEQVLSCWLAKQEIENEKKEEDDEARSERVGP